MPISFDRPNQRWRYQFDRYIAGQRQRASQLLPKGWSRAKADKFDQAETARIYAIATGVDNIERELNACADVYERKPFSALPQIARDYKPARDNGDGTPLKPATVKNRLAYIRAACRYAWKKHSMGEHDPAEKMEMPVVQNERHVYLNRRQFIEICRKMQPGAKRVGVRIAFYSGLRAGEVVKSVLYGDDGVQAFLLAPEDTKNGRPRAVPIHPKLAHIVRNPKLWPIRVTKWTVSKGFKAAARAAGYGHARLHDMRHSTASEMINGGADLLTVGGVLGHLSAQSTRRYVHLVTGKLAAAVNMVGKKSPTRAQKKTA